MNQKGQGLVEMAIITPLLLIMLIGVFEVGWVLRNKMILDTASREGARFASKSVNVNLSTEETAQEHYEDIVEQIKLASVGLPKELDGIIITNLIIKSGFPCDPNLRTSPITDTNGNVDYWPNCDCEVAVNNPYTSSIVASPLETPYFRYVEGEGESTLNITDTLKNMEVYNNKLNCNFGKSGGTEPSYVNHMIVVELFYSHNQLIGFPGLNLIDPIPLKSKASFRPNIDRAN